MAHALGVIKNTYLFLVPLVNDQVKLQMEGGNNRKGYLQINSSQSVIGFVWLNFVELITSEAEWVGARVIEGSLVEIFTDYR